MYITALVFTLLNYCSCYIVFKQPSNNLITTFFRKGGHVNVPGISYSANAVCVSCYGVLVLSYTFLVSLRFQHVSVTSVR